MISWLARLFGRAGDRKPAAPPGKVQSGPPASPVRSAEAPKGPARPDPGAGGRRPLVDRDGRLIGFEFRMHRALGQRSLERGDVAAQVAHAAVVLESMRATLAAGRLALFPLPLGTAVRPAILERIPAGAMIALIEAPGDDAADQAAVEALLKRGAFLGGCGFVFPSARFVVLDGARWSLDALCEAAAALRAGVADLQVVAIGMPSVDAVEAALKRGVDMAAGDVDRTALREQKTLPPRQQRVVQLLGRVVRGDELPQVAEDLRTEVELSYRLLRYANGPIFGLSRPVDSVDQAVLQLGRDALYRWLTVQLLGEAQGRRVSPALQEVALARARLLELLAPALRAPPPALFTVGLLSLLEVVLQVPLQEVLRPLNLSTEAQQALADDAGPWQPALALARALERGDSAAVESLAAQFGGVDTVEEQAAGAWDWAASATQQARGA